MKAKDTTVPNRSFKTRFPLIEDTSSRKHLPPENIHQAIRHATRRCAVQCRQMSWPAPPGWSGFWSGERRSTCSAYVRLGQSERLSKGEFKGKLQDARIASGGDRAEGSSSGNRIRSAERGRVRKVKSLGAEVEPYRLVYGKGLQQREIGLAVGGASDRIPGACAERKLTAVDGDCAGVDPLRESALIAGKRGGART